MLDGLRTLAALGLTYGSLAWFTQLDEVAAAADAVPDLTIVVNHCGSPLGYGPYAGRETQNFGRWKAGILKLAQRPNVVCKIGGVLMRGAAYDFIHAAAPPTSQELTRRGDPGLRPASRRSGQTGASLKATSRLKNWERALPSFETPSSASPRMHRTTSAATCSPVLPAEPSAWMSSPMYRVRSHTKETDMSASQDVLDREPMMEEPRSDTSKVAYQLPQPTGMLSDIFISNVLNLDGDERD